MIFNEQFLLEKNPWWEVPEAILKDEYLLQFEKLPYKFYHPLFTEFPKNQNGVLVLRGPRRVGKSTLLKLIMRNLLLKDKHEPLSIFYLSGEYISDFKELYDVLSLYLDFALIRTKSFLHLFVDEISFVREWQRAVKLLWDEGKLKKTLLTLTGSSQIDLLFSSEKLPDRQGRLKKKDFTFWPLNFLEFVKLVAPLVRPTVYELPKLRKLLHEFMLTGGFLKNINYFFENGGMLEPDSAKIFLQWVEGDFHALNKNENNLYAIINELIKTRNTPISVYEITKNAGLVSHGAVAEYLDILEKTFIARSVNYFSLEEKKVYLPKNKKYYFLDPFIFNVFLSKAEAGINEFNAFSKSAISSENYLPHIWESLVFQHLNRKFEEICYGRNAKNQEIDFTVKTGRTYHFFEVKYQNNIKQADFLWFSRSFPKEKLTVVTKNSYQTGEQINLIPLPLFLLGI